MEALNNELLLMFKVQFNQKALLKTYINMNTDFKKVSETTLKKIISSK